MVYLTSFQDMLKTYTGLALERDSEFRRLFDFHILRMWQSGSCLVTSSLDGTFFLTLSL